ncbi:DUF2145 domain-containing protein [Massilia sp.]|uniref:DUF2145 domain-containing protein n=1 Tax=Massilia sp. TaxID=1882437 RepID=UPI0028A2AB18|nr:DUF2145 domain-containing protein [Massilia sp.]
MRRILACAALVLAAQPAAAGTPCEGRAPSPELTRMSMQIADATRTALEGGDDDVVLIARAGQDLSRYRLAYSHIAFAVREHPAGAWSVVHKLNTCGTATSSLYDEGLLNFFSDSPYRYQAGIWRLAPEVQTRLKKALLGKKARDYHEPQYSLVAYPFSTRYQNSNGWALEMLAFALAPEDEANTRVTAQEWLKAHGFQPTELDLGTLTRLGARVSKANVSFDDHPSELRWKGRIQTVTVDSIVTWLRTLPNGCQAMGCPEMRVELPNQLR